MRDIKPNTKMEVGIFMAYLFDKGRFVSKARNKPKEIYALHEPIDFMNQKRIQIDTGSSSNFIQLARQDSKLHEMYKEILANDYILYFHQKTISKFYKRTHVHELFKRKDLIRHKDIFYTLDEPAGRKVNDEVPKKLLVIFTCMPDAKRYDSSLIPNRMFPKFFDVIERSLVKNVYTLRIMDLNVSHGSHYISTTNYPEYEQGIQSTILKVMEELNIDKEHVVLYGGSKGGTGAIYHGTAMDMNTLAVDPIVNIGGALEQKDRRFLKDLRNDDLVPQINQHLDDSNEYTKYVICSENVELYYKQKDRIDASKIYKINLADKHITSHPEVLRNSVPEQLTILNNFFATHI